MTTQSKSNARHGKIAGQPIVIDYRQPSTLLPDPRNARKHSKKQLAKLAAVITRFGFTNPILTDEDHRVIAGHARLAAAITIGLESVPCVQLVGLSEADKTALAIADNRLGEMSAFDPDVLAELLRELEEIDYDIELTGFDTAQIDALFAEVGANAPDPADVFHLPDAERAAVTLPGDLWLLGRHRLLCGNALSPTSYEVLLGSERADMIFTDPP